MKIINKKEAGIGPFFKEAMLHQFSHHTLPNTNRSFFLRRETKLGRVGCLVVHQLLKRF